MAIVKSKESITVDGVALKRGINLIEAGLAGKLRSSAWAKRGIYEFIEEKPSEDGIDYTGMSMTELRVLAKDKGINSFGKKKEELIAEIKGE